MRKIIYSFLLLAFVALPAYAQSSAQKLTTGDGGQIEVNLSVDKPIIMLGEITGVSFKIENRSKQNYDVQANNVYRDPSTAPDFYVVTIFRDDGKLVPQRRYTTNEYGGSWPALIASGSYTQHFALPYFAKFEETGTYLINLKGRLKITNQATAVSDDFAVELTTKIKVVPTDNEKLDAVIDSLARDMFNAPSLFDARSSLDLLGYIEDKRTIKYLAQALEKYDAARKTNSDTSFASQQAKDSFLDAMCVSAVWALAKFNDDFALEAIRKTTTGRSDYVRLAAAWALVESKHPQASNLLLNLRNDDYWKVRLLVLQAYAKMDTAEAALKIREFLKDDEEYIRTQAQKYLDKRKR